jgi:hypothetical protein
LSARTLPSEGVRKSARTASFPRCPVTFDSSRERCKNHIFSLPQRD